MKSISHVFKKIILISVLLTIALCNLPLLSCAAYGEKAQTATVDFSNNTGGIKYGAIGFLYGFSESDVPSGNLIYPLNAKIAAVKPPEGLQHPVGDVLHVADTFLSNGGEKLFVYMPDIYPEWYYVYRGQQDYLQKITDEVQTLYASQYKDSIVYCPFNEVDNGVWYGTLSKRKNRDKFHADWLAAYQTIKKIDPDAKIAGPGNMNYNRKIIKSFLLFCRDNDCLPDYTVWHELGERSLKKYEKNFASYRKVERGLKISPIDVIISEYGGMADNGLPGNMLRFLSMFENTKVEACQAYWRLANNLCDSAADNTTPNAAWWLYFWYSQMSGDTYKVNKTDPNLGVLAAYDNSDKRITLLAGGKNGNVTVKLKSLNEINMHDTKLRINVQCVEYCGLGADVVQPKFVQRTYQSAENGNLSITLKDCSATAAYLVEITIGNGEDYANTYLPKRYQAENAELSSDAVIRNRKDLTYASSNALVENVWNTDGYIDFTVAVECDSLYKIGVCYGNGYQTGNDYKSRARSSGYLIADDLQAYPLDFENTVFKETTDMTYVYCNLTAGEHKLTLTNVFGNRRAEGADVDIDFIDVERVGGASFSTETIPLTNRLNQYLAIVPENTYYYVNGELRFFKKGVNVLSEPAEIYECDRDLVEYLPDNTLSDQSGVIVTQTYTVSAQKTGACALIFTYSSNSQIGEHDYNVQHVEQYFNIKINGEVLPKRYYVRSTFSNRNFSERVVEVTLEQGENVIELFNDGMAEWNGIKPYMPEIVKMSIAEIR